MSEAIRQYLQCVLFIALKKLGCTIYHDLHKSLPFVPSDIMNNKVFYQHPNLMRVLGMHETVMEVMVNVLGGDKSQVRRHDQILTFRDSLGLPVLAVVSYSPVLSSCYCHERK